jgi:hypothetical protein
LAGLPSQVISWTKKLRREKQIIAEKEAINHVP